MKKTTLLYLAAAAALALTACGQTNATAAVATDARYEEGATVPAAAPGPAGTAASARNVISVTSSEEVKVVPDIAEVIYAVRTEDPDPAACQDKNTEAVSKVTALITDFGIDPKSVQTTDYYMNPIYDYSGQTQRLTGYEVRTSLTVTGVAIDKVGDLLSKSVKAGVNDIQSISYKSSNYSESYQEALKLALESARKKAETLAAAGGCTVGGVAGITEHGGNYDLRYTDNALTSKMATAEMAYDQGMQVMPGEISVSADITVEYFIQ